jgi:NADP-dependent 3-hydroxy acid dehydrogenase YdfG
MSQPRLAGKRVIVTGAGQGLGRAFALHLAGLGAQVIAADVRADLGALAFLICDESAFVTGQTLLVNGGRLSH